MKTSRLTELRLTRFKSFRNAVVPLDGLAVLTGRNSSGKSNVLDALDVLSRLAAPERLRDSLDGRRRGGGPVRGGSRGLAPYGETTFELGCTVRVNDGDTEVEYLYDVAVDVSQGPRVIWERLREQAKDETGLVREASPAVVAQGNDSGRMNSITISEGKAPFSVSAENTALSFLGNVEIDSPDQRLAEAVAITAQVLRDVVIFNVDASRMRTYVPKDGLSIEPDMANLSAVAHFMKDEYPGLFDRLEALTRDVAGCPVKSLDFVTGDEGREVMLALNESETSRTDARSMSDGLLRFLGIATALLLAPRSGDFRMPAGGESSGFGAFGYVLAIEEIENGLHPSHAARLFELVEEAAGQAGVSVIITTHSPALLDAVGGAHARDVLVCHDGQVTRMPDLPGYDRAMARGTLGRVVSQGLLTGPVEDEPADYSEFLRLIGAQ